MPINIEETKVQLKIVKGLSSTHNFLQETFFPENRPSLSNKIIIKKGRIREEISTLVSSPESDHKIVSKGGYDEIEVLPVCIKETFNIEASDLDKLPLEAPIQSDYSPAEIARSLRNDYLIEGKSRIYRRIEAMCGDLLGKGEISLGSGQKVTFQFPTTHKVSLVGDAKWNNADSKPLDNLNEWVQRVSNNSGIVPTKMVMGAEAYGALFANENFLKLLDIRRITIGEIKPERYQKLGAQYKGYLNEIGMDIYVYSKGYSEGGTAKKYIDPKSVIIGTNNIEAASLEWARIRRNDVAGPMAIYTGRYVDEKKGTESILFESCPLPIFSNPKAFFVAKVLS